MPLRPGAWCSITEHPRGFCLRFGVDGEPDDFRAVVDSLKASVPKQYRRFDPSEKHWIIGLMGASGIKEWITNNIHPDEVDLEPAVAWLDPRAPGSAYTYGYGGASSAGSKSTAGASAPSASPKEQAFQSLHLLPTAPPALIKAAYRALAQIHHPDRGGDTKLMQQINSAYELLGRGETA